ncbi:TetR family transcriptional regulator [Streptomyces alfalfae]|uniref:Transcriptional regulator n=1 Tax=Streptomyces alfalfae TaxID=1642299 RepID=A0ABM6H134_9ACTN|nr:TetR/AcrR family transcriptional regulator [Streptomyces alfalfae]AYA20316.1 TetR/AcrR family transcriptional regulator [Streptomyces fradiae]APY89861.1 transcriptional regulator [Streptomyces alfalfae]QUI30077.1 TetR/AcrR family transcriptional regulator [Streptomyces alfalfae]RXX42681.1 TetR family transcriptional regulator [Streptomyces alfalfae]RZM83124.1 TetR/AcrR family transcriptional regulator [Streptomyces alfalfae]
MTSTSIPARGRPPRLSRDRALHTALDLLDRSGLDALTMRRLADALEVRAGALYRYFATKQDLLTAMAERMMEGVTEAAAEGGEGDWGERLAALARAMRTALLGHRDGARVFAGTHATGANILGYADTVVGLLREAGFADDDAARALYTVANFTVGHTLEEQAALHPGEERPADPGLLRDAVEAGAYPHLGATLPALASGDFDRLFEFGLGLLVDGLRARRRPGGE